MSDLLQRRTLFTRDASLSLEFAAADEPADAARTLTGYAILWGAVSDDRGGYRVRILPNAVRFQRDSLALYHHDYRLVIGNALNRTLRFVPDDRGVKVEIDLPDTSTGRDVAELVAKRYVTGMSWSMINVTDSREVTEGGESIVEIISAEADEVTVTAIPAFASTSIAPKPQPVQHARTAQAIELQRLRLAVHRLSV